MTLEELASELAAGRLRGAYAIAGPEPLLRDEALASLRSCVLRGAPAEFNLDRLEGDTATPGALRDALRTLPVGAARRLVWLREPGGRGRALAEALSEVVCAQAADSPSVLVVTASNLDRREKWVRAFADAGALVECEAPQGARALVDFVRREAARLAIPIEPAAAELLVERGGPELLRLRGELEKAALLAGRGCVVTFDHVSRGVADLADEPVWELTDAIGDGRAGDALAGLAKLLASGGAPPVVLGALAGHFRRLLRLRAGGTVGAPPFVRRKLEEQARRYALARLLACLRAIHDTDEALKGQGGLDAQLALERLVIGLAA